MSIRPYRDINRRKTKVVNLGNVKDNSLIEIWNSEKFRKIRNHHSLGNRNKIDICVGCQIWDSEIKSIYYKKK